MSEWSFVYPGEDVAYKKKTVGDYDWTSIVMYCGVNGGVMVFKQIREISSRSNQTDIHVTEDLFYHNAFVESRSRRYTARFLGEPYEIALVSEQENPVRVLRVRKIKQDDRFKNAPRQFQN